MRVLVTGSDGYIGQVLVPLFEAAGHDVVGADTGYFEGCDFGAVPPSREFVRSDVREIPEDVFRGIDAVVHLAAISNDPLGDLNPACTHAINHHATVATAVKAKAAGVRRFLHSSSCSLYGAQGDAPISEDGEFNPVTPYGESKVWAERDLSSLADDDFSPTYLRNATAYGASPRLRGDLVVNNLTGWAVTTGKVFLKSDGTSWRPLVHIEDISRAFLALMEAELDVVHDEAFNVGTSAENYLISDVARLVAEIVPNCTVSISDNATDDPRNYRVNCDKLARTVPGFEPKWTVAKGIKELAEAFTDFSLSVDDLEGDRFMRVKRILRLLDSGRLDQDLRWREQS